MPKPRQAKGKYHSKKSRDRQRQALVSQQHPGGETAVPAAAISTPSPVKTTVSSKAPKAAHYPYAITELRRIGILTGIVLVILIVLSRILS